jgi:hypothetical protein
MARKPPDRALQLRTELFAAAACSIARAGAVFQICLTMKGR